MAEFRTAKFDLNKEIEPKFMDVIRKFAEQFMAGISVGSKSTVTGSTATGGTGTKSTSGGASSAATH
jgi:hypothetical protein